MIRFFGGLATVAMILAGACSKDKEVVDPCPYDHTQLTYNGLVKSIFNSTCATTNACHIPGGDGEGDFDTYAGVKIKINNGTMRTRLTDSSNPMPPPGSGFTLDPCDKQKLLDWIDKGAPEN